MEIIGINGAVRMDQNSLQQEERDWYSKALIENKSEDPKK